MESLLTALDLIRLPQINLIKFKQRIPGRVDFRIIIRILRKP